MVSRMERSDLETYWFSFPEDPHFPIGLGVTAWSLSDAYALLEANGYDFHKHASRVEVHEGITVADLDQMQVVGKHGTDRSARYLVSCFELRFRGSASW